MRLTNLQQFFLQMIQISEHILLQPILLSDCKELFDLMQHVYPPAYKHFWNDDCSWYINNQYSSKNILKELNQVNSEYYFVVYQGKKVGNFRFVWDEKLNNLPFKKTVKLHRIYLHKNTQGKGIGKTLLYWLENQAKQKKYDAIWLDAMDKKHQAFLFYKKLGYTYHSHCYLGFKLLKEEYRKMSQLYKHLCS